MAAHLLNFSSSKAIAYWIVHWALDSGVLHLILSSGKNVVFCNTVIGFGSCS